MNFLKIQVSLDKYGVWAWLFSILESSEADIAKQYAYGCAKAFLKMGHKRPQNDFSFTALRGLVYGLAKGQPDERRVNVTESPHGIPAVLLRNDDGIFGVDRIFGLGMCETGGKRFEPFAQALRGWLQQLESDRGGTSRLSEIKLKREGEACLLELWFTEPLPERIFAGEDMEAGGQVTLQWRALAACFGQEQQPIVSGRSVTFRFTLTKQS